MEEEEKEAFRALCGAWFPDVEFGKALGFLPHRKVNERPSLSTIVREIERGNIKSLLAAIHTLYPASCGQVQKMIEGYTVPPVSTLAKALTSDLELLPERFLLILDNYEETSSQRINDFLSNLLTGSLPTIHLVLITSRNPSLPLRTLRVNNELSELRLANLLPDLEETVHWRDILTNREYEILLNTVLGGCQGKSCRSFLSFRKTVLSLPFSGF